MNTFAEFPDCRLKEGQKIENNLTLIAVVDESIIKRLTTFTITDGRSVASVTLSDDQLKDLTTAINARLNGDISAFSGTFNQ